MSCPFSLRATKGISLGLQKALGWPAAVLGWRLKPGAENDLSDDDLSQSALWLIINWYCIRWNATGHDGLPRTVWMSWCQDSAAKPFRGLDGQLFHEVYIYIY